MSFLFRRTPQKGNNRHEETALQRFFRIILVGILFAGVIYGFWLNNERQMDRAMQRIAPQADTTGTLSSEQENLLRTYALRFFAEYGVKIQISIQNSPLSDEEARQSKSVFLGINPKERAALFYAPPWVASALGEAFIHRLNEEFFIPYFADGNWPEGLAEALSMLSVRLDAALLHKPGKNATVQPPASGTNPTHAPAPQSGGQK